ncbi:MAG: class I SAM-dependent methyltransferase [Anaerolineaceae bacterium]|nr:class I SAM-dependent methyltransferase [Anaerolineaceae bacterium]
MNISNPYRKEPLGERQGIPYFSEADFYTKNYEKISQDHLAVFEKEGRNPNIEEGLWVELEDSTATLLDKYAQPGDKILDVGVGLGRLLSRFGRLERYGMDISWEYLEYTRKTGIEVCFSRIEDMPYRKDYFDLITCTDVLEHVLDLNLALTRILEVLKPGGTLIVRVPYRENLALYLEADYPYRYVHLRNFDEYGLELLFTRVFDCRFLESQTAGYLASPRTLRVILPLSRWNRITEILSSFSKTFLKPFYKHVLHALYYPIDINVVIQKPG